MKQWFKDKFDQIRNWVSGTVLPKLKKASVPAQIIGYVLLVIVVVALVLSFFAALVFVMILLPGMIVGLFAWLAWTYFGLGATYFAMLDPIYLHIPYWHFAWGFAALIFIIRVVRKKGYGKSRTPGEINAHDGSWKLKKSST